MAQVYRPTFYVNSATGKRVKAGTPDARKRKSPTWHIRYWTPAGVRVRVKGYKDRKATEAYAVELERKADREAAGYADVAEEHARRPLEQHAADFLRGLTAKGNVGAYVATVGFRLTAVLDGCRFIKIGDIQASGVLDFLAALKAKGKSHKTVNDYLHVAKAFTRWLWKDRRTAVDPLAGLPRLPAKGGDSDIRHARRDFAPDELRRLLDSARRSDRTRRRLSGIDRHFLYLTAAATGLRASELASLTPESFDLDGDPATVTVASACTKNRRQAVQPLPADVALALSGYLAGKPAGAPVWPGKWRRRAFKMIHSDMRDARKGWIAESADAAEREERERSDFLRYRDDAGRYADFHALRHSYITAVGKTGASPKVHQELARHSTYALTGRYTHARLHDLAATVASLPPLVPPAGEALAATGTDGKPQEGPPSPDLPRKRPSARQATDALETVRISLGPSLSPQVAKTGDYGRQSEARDIPMSQAKNPGKQAVFGVFRGQLREAKNVGATGLEPVTPSVSSRVCPSRKSPIFPMISAF
jgi:site-specific recombinase XerD